MTRAVAIGTMLAAVVAHGQWLNVELPALDRDEINAERTRQRPVPFANAALCGHEVIRYRGELVCDFFLLLDQREPPERLHPRTEWTTSTSSLEWSRNCAPPTSAEPSSAMR